jgi:asparagine synthase (glutamine-hydrolysing)
VRFEDAVEETERLLMEAVALRLQADVPVGVLLSSGIDSSLVCWAVAKLGSRIRAYTVGVPGDPWDETSGARETARAVGIQHSVLEMAEPDISSVDTLVEAYAEPFACSSALGMLRVSRAVADEATVLLTGDGGDDVFLGYPRHRHSWLAQRLARLLPTAAAPIWSAVRRGIPRIGPLRRARAFVDYATGGMAALEASDETLSYYSSNAILGDRLRGRFVREGTGHQAWSVAVARTIFEDQLARAQRTHFVGEYLPKVDGTTMYFGLEARSPFLDQRLWEFAASLPVEVRLHGFHLKAVLREIVRRRIGATTARRRKRGFGIPVHRWLANGWHEAARSVWERSVLQEEGLVDANAVARAFGNARTNGVAPLPLWYLFILEMWLRRERSDAALNPKTERNRQASFEIRSPAAGEADFSVPIGSAESDVSLNASTAKRN